MTLLDHPIWSDLAPYIRIEIYGRDGGPHHPRHRIEVDTLPPALRARALRVRVPCVACGQPIHPIRARKSAKGNGHLYYAPCCPLSVRIACSRGDQARDNYVDVRAAVDRARPLRRQQSLEL